MFYDRNRLIPSETLAELEARGKLASTVIIKHVSTGRLAAHQLLRRNQFDADFTPIYFVNLRRQLSSEGVARLQAAQDPQ